MKRVHSVRPGMPTAPAAAVTDAPVRPTRVFHVLAGVSARRVRGLSLLVSLLLALVVPSLAAFSLAPWWSVPVVLVSLMADIFWLRHAAVSGRASARARGRRSAEGGARSAGGPVAESEDESELWIDPQSESESEAGSRPPAEPRVAGAVDPIEPAAQADPSGWAPVPVPPPTYTLKARAPEPVSVPAAVAEPTASEPWSLEGMVFDCELDELVERRSATGA